METSAADMEFDFGVVNLSGSANLDLNERSENALARSIQRVQRETLERRTLIVPMFQSAL